MTEAIINLEQLPEIELIVTDACAYARAAKRVLRDIRLLAAIVGDHRPLGYAADFADSITAAITECNPRLGREVAALVQAFDLDLHDDRNRARARTMALVRSATQLSNLADKTAEDAVAELARRRLVEQLLSKPKGFTRGLPQAELPGAAQDDLPAGPESLASGWRQPLGVSVRVTEWVAQLLPPVDRRHYVELYQSELSELAQDPRPRRAQLAYTIRVVTRALPLRRALRTSGPPSRITIS